MEHMRSPKSIQHTLMIRISRTTTLPVSQILLYFESTNEFLKVGPRPMIKWPAFTPPPPPMPWISTSHRACNLQTSILDSILRAPCLLTRQRLRFPPLTNFYDSFMSPRNCQGHMLPRNLSLSPWRLANFTRLLCLQHTVGILP